jgi:hypothetical protein
MYNVMKGANGRPWGDNRDGIARQASRLIVQFEVGELCFIFEKRS